LRKLQLEKLFNKFKNGVKGKRTRKVRKKQKKKTEQKITKQKPASTPHHTSELWIKGQLMDRRINLGLMAFLVTDSNSNWLEPGPSQARTQ
jgi:hypothetical protein